jgi:hypothetical protein
MGHVCPAVCPIVQLRTSVNVSRLDDLNSIPDKDRDTSATKHTQTGYVVHTVRYPGCNKVVTASSS